MSFYTVFDSDTVVTSTTTANLMAATDPVLIHSSATKRKAQSTVGSVATLWPTSTSSSTATNLPNFGQIVLTSASSVAWIINDPSQKGQLVSIFNTSSTSTNNVVLTNTATIIATDTQTGVSVQFQKSGTYAEMTSLSTSVWMVTGRSAAALNCT